MRMLCRSMQLDTEALEVRVVNDALLEHDATQLRFLARTCSDGSTYLTRHSIVPWRTRLDRVCCIFAELCKGKAHLVTTSLPTLPNIRNSVVAEAGGHLLVQSAESSIRIRLERRAAHHVCTICSKSGQRRSHHWSWQVAATSAAIASPSSNIGSTGYGGIGYALAKTFAGHKMKLALIDNSQEHLSKAVSEMQSGSSNDDVLSVKADVSSFEDMQKAAKEVNDKFGKVNVLCLNAGTGAKGANTFDSDMASWQKVSPNRRPSSPGSRYHIICDQVLGVNLLGVIYGSNAFVGDMVKSKEDGLVIVTGSKQGITCPPASGAAYNVSKAGVKTFTEQLAHELREATDERITAHLLVPGWTFTKVRTPVLIRGRESSV